MCALAGIGFLLSFTLMAAPPEPKPSAKQEPLITRAATCRWADRPPVIDGKLDDPVWSRAEPIDRFAAFWARAAVDPGSRARLLWDNDALYFAARLTDAEIRSFGTKRQDHIYKGDVFELFFKPDRDRPAYYEFEVNPASVVMELTIPARPFDYNTVANATPPAIQVVVVVDGTLNRPGDRDRGWHVEGKIPWKAFAPTGGRPTPGAVWSFALCRYDYGPDGTKPVTLSSAPLTEDNFHRYEDYGRLTFEGPNR
jgi:hypothetical protein